MEKLNTFLQETPITNTLTEWGTPPGSMGRVLPALVIKSLGQKCLWVTDNQESEFYPAFWNDLQIDLTKLYFLRDEKPMKNLRRPLEDSKFKLMVLDLQQRVAPSDMNSLGKYCKKNQVTCLLLRKFFLSPKNGNPFSKYRFNCSYSLRQNSFCLSLVKGPRHKRLELALPEVLGG